jgi:hypothetical protein
MADELGVSLAELVGNAALVARSPPSMAFQIKEPPKKRLKLRSEAHGTHRIHGRRNSQKQA